MDRTPISARSSESSDQNEAGERSISPLCDVNHLFHTMSHEQQEQEQLPPRKWSSPAAFGRPPPHDNHTFFTKFAEFSSWPMNVQQLPDPHLSSSLDHQPLSPFTTLNSQDRIGQAFRTDTGAAGQHRTYRNVAVHTGKGTTLATHTNTENNSLFIPRKIREINRRASTGLMSDRPGALSRPPPKQQVQLEQPLRKLLSTLRQRKAQLHESSSAHKTTFKEFSKQFRALQKQEWKPAYDYAIECLSRFPTPLHWKVCLEVGEFIKRKSMLNLSRHWYEQAHFLQPFAAQTWLEHAKLEEECGELVRATQLLEEGLYFCPLDENLLIKALKLYERMQLPHKARQLLATIVQEPIESCWKVVFEGALFEGRAGQLQSCRAVLRFLMHVMPWYGPVYLEAFRLEERHGYDRNAKEVLDRGLEILPRYGPLWFAAFHLYERFEPQTLLFERALDSISRELVWKVHLERALRLQRCADFAQARQYFRESVVSAPQNLRWRVWLLGGRMELQSGRISTAKTLLNRSFAHVPPKNRAMVLLEAARVYEYLMDVEGARNMLKRAREETRHEWKVFLESVLVEIRAGNVSQAVSMAQNALQIHCGTGRLWALLIQLSSEPPQQMQLFKQALAQVPKSGEVWCEGARMCLDPTLPFFHPPSAKRFLQFAIQFTPQYGDSFIESLRLEMMSKGFETELERDTLRELELECVNADPNYGALWFRFKRHCLDSARDIFGRAKQAVWEEMRANRGVMECVLGGQSLQPQQIEQWKGTSMNSIEMQYPLSKDQSEEERFQSLFGCSASFHD